MKNGAFSQFTTSSRWFSAAFQLLAMVEDAKYCANFHSLAIGFAHYISQVETVLLLVNV